MNQKRSRSKSHASRIQSERQIPGWLWLLTGMVLGGFIMFLVHLSELKRKGVSGAPETPQAQASKKTPAEKPSKTESNSPKELIFEFYDRLKEEQITVPEYERKEVQPTHHYFLQVASFSRMEDADKARARLFLLNMTPEIETTKLQSGATMHRIIVGPYENKSKLAKARQTLVSNGFEYLTLKRKIEP